jgi:hypothetical protein
MNFMMETMTMTRKVMWRFKSSSGCCVPWNFFSPLGCVGGKDVVSPILGWSPPGLLLIQGKDMKTIYGSRTI